MPKIEITAYLLILITLLPTILMFLIHKAIVNKLKNNFLDIEKDNLALNATILDLEKQLLESLTSSTNNIDNAGIVRMSDKQSTKVV